MASINTRISDELQKKLDEAIKEVKKKLPRGAEVNTSSIMRSSLEKFVEDTEKEKKKIITVDFPLNDMVDEEQSELYDFLSGFYKKIVDRKAKIIPEIKTDNEIYFRELREFNSIQEGATTCLLNSVDNTLRK